MEQAAARSDVVVGELLSTPTLSLATAARLAGLVLVSPTATDERIGSVGPSVFQVGPGSAARAAALAELVLGNESHRVAFVGSAASLKGAFAAAFAREAEQRGGRVVRRDPAPATGADASSLADLLHASGADVLFWDGPSRNAELLVRALARSGTALKLCGGPSLAPEGMQPAARPLLEGVVYVSEDWQLPERERARLDSLATAAGTRPGALWTRGYLAGRAIAAAVDAGALAADEVASRLRGARSAADAGGFLDVSGEGATLPVYVVHDGKPVDARRAPQ